MLTLRDFYDIVIIDTFLVGALVSCLPGLGYESPAFERSYAITDGEFVQVEGYSPSGLEIAVFDHRNYDPITADDPRYRILDRFLRENEDEEPREGSGSYAE